MIFPSSILQISVSNHQAPRTGTRNTIYLAIRTELFTYIISVDIAIDLHTYRTLPVRSKLFPLGTSPIQVREVDRIDLARTQGVKHVDVIMHPSKRRECAIVDANGQVWRWRMVTNKNYAGTNTYGKL